MMKALLVHSPSIIMWFLTLSQNPIKDQLIMTLVLCCPGGNSPIKWVGMLDDQIGGSVGIHGLLKIKHDP